MDDLPVEIVIKIFSYLNSYDLMQFCNIFGQYKYVLQDMDVVRTVDFSGKFEVHKIHLYNYISKKINCNCIKFLNINYIYWIPSRDLRRLIRKLENLEVLYAFNTKLGIVGNDICEYTKLKKLAVSVEDNTFDRAVAIERKNLSALKSLRLKIARETREGDGIYELFLGLQQLEELWISEDIEHVYHINFNRLVQPLNNLKKLCIKTKSISPFYDFSELGLVKIFECRRSSTATDLIFEKVTRSKGKIFSIFEPTQNQYEKTWQVFQCLHKDVAYGPKESRRVYTTGSIKDIYFEELNFCHVIICCNAKYTEAASRILSYKNCSKLKKLSFRSCVFQLPSSPEENENSPEESERRFKRLRKGVQTNSAFHPFQTTANNLKELRELEISTCLECTTGAVISAYPSIGIFEHLEKLVLEIPLLLDGSFLHEVFTKCQHLESLYLFCKGHNDKFILNLCQNLKFTQNLRHFRLDYKDVPLTKLLSSFNEIQQKKLLRMFVKCDSIRSADNQVESFSVFMEHNRQLVFCVYVISGNTNKQNSDIQHTLNKFKFGNPAKIFSVKKDMSSFSGVFPIPTAHRDIMFVHTNVAVINLDQF